MKKKVCRIQMIQVGFLGLFAFPLMLGLWVGCLPQEDSVPSPSKPIAIVFPGQSDQTVTLPETVLNRYAVLEKDVAKGSQNLKISKAGLAALSPLLENDLLLVMQMQGAQMDTSQTPNYGTVVLPTQAGRYEFVWVRSINQEEGIITIDPQSGGLQHDYTVLGKTQIVFVPQYKTLTIAAGASVKALPWNGVL